VIALLATLLLAPLYDVQRVPAGEESVPVDAGREQSPGQLLARALDLGRRPIGAIPVS